jgi:excisionase family DNA binding protein
MQTIAHRREQFLSPKEAAHLLGLDVSSIYRACARGELPSVRLLPKGAIRIPRSALDPETRP